MFLFCSFKIQTLIMFLLSCDFSICVIFHVAVGWSVQGCNICVEIEHVGFCLWDYVTCKVDVALVSYTLSDNF